MSYYATERTFDEQFAIKLYKSGKDDKAIAKECRVKAKTISDWRKRNNLEANTVLRVRRHGKHELTQLDQDAIEARKHGMTYGQYKASYDRAPLFRQKRRRNA